LGWCIPGLIGGYSICPACQVGMVPSALPARSAPTGVSACCNCCACSALTLAWALLTLINISRVQTIQRIKRIILFPSCFKVFF
tara:strand:- start:102466 stop:102717 length:252 start_codon:yes stop_codon:yes gene_type:complete